MQLATYDNVKNKIIEIRHNKIILDSDVAVLYGVETKHINQAVKNNPERFPEGFIMELTEQEKAEVVKNFDHLHKLKFSRVLPKAFTERGLYMLATVLKSPKAVEASIAIIKTFTLVRDISSILVEITKVPENEVKQKSLIQKASTMIGKLIAPSEDELEVLETETTYKFSFLSTIEFTKKTKRGKKPNHEG
jgi:hypothetical protein